MVLIESDFLSFAHLNIEFNPSNLKKGHFFDKIVTDMVVLVRIEYYEHNQY